MASTNREDVLDQVSVCVCMHAHPAVTSMVPGNNWEISQTNCCPCFANGYGPGGTSCAHTIILVMVIAPLIVGY